MEIKLFNYIYAHINMRRREKNVVELEYKEGIYVRSRHSVTRYVPTSYPLSYTKSSYGTLILEQGEGTLKVGISMKNERM